LLVRRKKIKRVDHLYDEEFFKELEMWNAIPKNYDNSLPFILNECIFQMSVSIEERLEDGDDYYEVLRQHLNTRGKAFQKCIEELMLKYSWIEEINKIINIEKRPFILYLQDFAKKNYIFEHGTMIKAENYSGKSDICLLAEKFQDTFIVYVSIPFDDAEIDYTCLNMIHGEHRNILRIDCDRNWLDIVKLYIKEASCILVNIKDFGNGTKKEIDFIKQESLLNKTVFCTDNKQLVFDYIGEKVDFLDKDYISVGNIYSNNLYIRSEQYLPVSVLWINGDSRKKIEEQLSEIETLFIEKYKSGEKCSVAIQLDGCFVAIGMAIALEDFSRIVSYLWSIINLISFYSKKKLKNRNKLLSSFLSYFLVFNKMLCKTEDYKAVLLKNKEFLSNYWHTSFLANITVMINKFLIMKSLQKNICIER